MAPIEQEPEAGKVGVVRPASHAGCMVCGLPSVLGLSFHATEQGVKASLKLKPEWQGYSSALHGGMIATLLDAAMTHCLFHQGIEAMTADLQVRYLAPVPCPGRIEVSARLSGQRRLIYELDAELRVGGMVKARAKAKFMRDRNS
ncbi:MAG: PaaI family thioesterase [Propionivibrio sp.]|nr:PaaI family thioesterase [Propionivibrio sp.]